jgi:hypothetical protein
VTVATHGTGNVSEIFRERAPRKKNNLLPICNTFPLDLGF